MKKEENQSLNLSELPLDLLNIFFSSLKLQDLKQVKSTNKFFLPISRDIGRNKCRELKKTASELIKVNDKSIDAFLQKARKEGHQWLLDYCYQEVVKLYFLDNVGHIDHLKVDNRNQGVFDWAIKCFQPEEIVRPLFETTPFYDDFYFKSSKLSLALRVGSIPVIKLLIQHSYEVKDTLECLIMKK